MRQLNNYILEKLHISKDFKRQPGIDSLRSGDRLFVIELNDKENLKMYSHLFFIKLENNQLTYYNSRSNTRLRRKVFLNSNKFYETTNREHNNFIGVFMTAQEGVDFLNSVEPDKVLNDFIYKKYFNEGDDKFINDNSIVCSIWSTGVINDRLNELKQGSLRSSEIKSLTEKLHINKDYKIETNLRKTIIDIVYNYCKNKLKMEYANYIIDFCDKNHRPIYDDVQNINNLKYIDIYCDKFTDDPEKVINDIQKEIESSTNIKIVNASILRSGVEISFEV